MTRSKMYVESYGRATKARRASLSFGSWKSRSGIGSTNTIKYQSVLDKISMGYPPTKICTNGRDRSRLFICVHNKTILSLRRRALLGLMMRVRLIYAANVVLIASTLFGSAKICSFFVPSDVYYVPSDSSENNKRYTVTPSLRRDDKGSSEAARLQKRKKSIQVMYGIAGDADETLHEFEVSIRSLLMSSPTDSDFNIHLLTDQAAYDALDDIFKRSKIASWSLRNQVTIKTYNLQPRIQEFTDFIVSKTRTDMNYSIAKHTIANYFGLLASKVIKPSSGFVLNMDTDIVVMADLEALWKQVDESSLFQWATNGGFVLFNLDRQDEFWKHIGEIKEITSSKKNGHIGDQRLMDMINISFPEKVAILPDEWYITLSRLKKLGLLRKTRPDGAGMLHLNGNQKVKESSFISAVQLHDKRERSGWGLANYYIDITWPWAKFIAESHREGEGFPIKIIYGISGDEEPMISDDYLASSGDSNAHSPELVWIMAYPNSGTTYTLALMEQVTNSSMATNYMGDVLQPVPDVPIYEDQPQGPFWRGLADKPLPETSVLVKTHCAGYKERPKDVYDMSLSIYIHRCGRTTILKPKENDDGWYDPREVHKAIHVVRSPFDNLIARFNNYHFKQDRRGKHPYEKNREGFRAFCRQRDTHFDKKYRKSTMSRFVKELAERTICHDNVIAYVLWHNRAFEAIEEMELNTLQIRYEDYEDNFEETLSNLLNFLDLPEKGEPLEFHSGHHYDDYYTEQERKNIHALAKALASKKTWKAISQYFG